MRTYKRGKHLTLEDRNQIYKGIVNGNTKAAIAKSIGVDKSTVGKEIKNNGQWKKPPHTTDAIRCANMQTCKHHHLCTNCPDFSSFICSRRDHSPGACDGCSKLGPCRRMKFRYSPNIAQAMSDKKLHESREGVNLTEEEAAQKGALIKKLIDQGQSPYMIITDHPELGMSVKTLYNYIDEHAFVKAGVLNVDLRLKTKRRSMSRKTVSKYKKRHNRKYLVGRTYDDEKNYINELEANGDKHVSIVEMDTVYNNGTAGPFMQTFKFIDCDILFALYHTSKTADEMVKGVDLIEQILGPTLFRKVFQVLLTDRGSEFVDADGFEKNGRTRIFYCDPMMAGQKGSLENVHRQVRYILPKEKDLLMVGLKSQEDLNHVVSEINSSPKAHLNGTTPFELVKLFQPELVNKLIQFGLQVIPKDDVILTSKALKANH